MRVCVQMFNCSNVYADADVDVDVGIWTNRQQIIANLFKSNELILLLIPRSLKYVDIWELELLYNK